MRRFLLLFLLVGVALSSNAMERIKLASFHEISVSGSVDVILVKGLQEYVDFEMISGDKEEFNAEVKNGKLNIYLKKGGFWFKTGKAKVTVSYRSLDAISASAGSKMKSESPINSSMLTVESSSGASLNLPVKSTNLKGSASSGSTLKLSGDANNIDLQASSGCNIDASALTANKAEVQSSSGAWVGVKVNESLIAKASSGGSVKYKATTTCKFEKETSSGGSVSKM